MPLSYTPELGKIIYEAKLKTPSNQYAAQQIFAQFGEYPSSDRRIRRWHERYLADNGLMSKEGHDKPSFNRFAMMEVVSSYGTHTITQQRNVIQYPELNHYDNFKNIKAEIIADNDEIRIVALNDLHFPYGNKPMLSKVYKAIKRFNPHFINLGSDEFDCPNISKFATSPHEISQDFLKPMMQQHKEHVDNLKKIAPQAELFFLMGNHDLRLFKFIIEKVSQFGDYLTEHIISDISYKGVHFLGWDVDAVSFVSDNHRRLVLAHGHRASKYVAESSFLDYMADYLVVGHIHRINDYNKTVKFDGEYLAMRAISTGCLCDLRPKYLSSSERSANWQAGFAFIRFNTRNGDCSIENIVANPQDNSFYWGNEKY